MTKRDDTPITDTERLIAAVEDVAEQIGNLNATLERFMEMTLTKIGGESRYGTERYALRTLPITD
jgi:hypothetical protein